MVMGNLLYLVHRMPYPPNKGDKVRSYHLLRHLQKRHRVFLGTFVDDPADEAHIEALGRICPDLYVERLARVTGWLRNLRGLFRRQPLTVSHYRSASMQRWVQHVSKQHHIHGCLVVSSAMAPYACALPKSSPLLVDFVDVDSAKWAQYALTHRWPLSWLFRREGVTLQRHERAVAGSARDSFLVSTHEVDLFLDRAPECTGRVHAIGNGVDAAHFEADPSRASPFSPGELAVVFVGTMNYWPNIDAVSWFANEIWPQVVSQQANSRFYIVGRNPTAAVRALAGHGIVVTGTVADVRPYVQHAAVVVAPVRVAPGIQNKILEAMAMGRPVVTVSRCAEVVGAAAGQGLIPADEAAVFARAVLQLLEQPEQGHRLGQLARSFVQQNYCWDTRLSGLDPYLDAIGAEVVT